MRRCLVCLSLLAFALGCAVTPDNNPRVANPEDTPDQTPRESPISADQDKSSQKAELLPEPKTEPAVLNREVMEGLAKTDPIAFLEKVVEKYDREVKSYKVTLEKQERVKGKLLGVEVIECSFREKPFSVRMDWKKGAGKASKTVFVKGENDNKLLVLPAGPLARLVAGVVKRDPEGSDAKASSRYPVTEFGIQVGTRRTLKSWKEAKEKGNLKVSFEGVKQIKKLGDRSVWVMKRTGYAAEEDGAVETDSTFYFDVENFLQIGSYLTDKDGKVIGSYYFRDLELNVDFPKDTFSKAGLEKK
jgi:hypothetical protein